jgi:hypothetical protein
MGNVRKKIEAAEKELHGSGKQKCQLKLRTLCLKIHKKLLKAVVTTLQADNLTCSCTVSIAFI